MHVLYGRPGWGSALVEAQLAWYGLPFETVDLDDLFKSAAARDRLAKVNPLAQVPTLQMPDGSVMTESAAITLLLGDAGGARSLAPAAGDPSRAAFLRWLVFLVTNVYPTFTYGDDPARFVPDETARAGYLERVNAWRERMWSIVEAEAVTPWFCGSRFSAIDIYVAVMTRWTPKRPWFAANCPKLTAIARKVDALPELQGVWARHFPEG
ncbi:MAG: glutathione S-transferase family protein [Reyranellaceae bacterium]